MEQIFALDGKELAGGVAQARLFEFAGDRSLMKLDGADHRTHRGCLSRALDPAGMPELGDLVLGRVHDEVVTWPRGERFDLGRKLDRLALELVAQVCLAGAPEMLLETTRRGMKVLADASTPIGIALASVRLGRGPGFIRDARRLIEGHVNRRIAMARQGTTAPNSCVFHRLLSGSEGGRTGLATEDLEDGLMTVMAAMLGGLSCSMKHSFAWVLRTGGVAERVRDELRGAVAASDPRVIDENLYLDSVSKEILRLSPDIPFAVRQAMTDVAIGRWRLPLGTTLGIGIHLIHHRAATFPDPDRFVAERFVGWRPSRFDYLPFGGGRRGCVAAGLFPYLQKLILAGVLGKVRLRLLDASAVPVTSFAIVSTPARKLWAVAEPIRAGYLPPHHLPGMPRGEPVCPGAGERGRQS